MSKQITDLVEALALNDTDLILARQGSEDKKALISTLISKINSGLPVADSSNKGIVDKELLLQLLLLVDGSGSGLDADILDGEHGSFYTNAGNLNAGTVPTARLPSASTVQKGVVQQATTLEAENGTVGKFPDAAGVLAAITANSPDLLNTTRIDVASATTVDLNANAPDTRHVNITGTTTITGFTVSLGACYFVRFGDTGTTLTKNAAIYTPSGANIVTTAGDTCIIRAIAADVVEVLCYSSVHKRVLSDVKSSRNFGVAYTNTSGREIEITVGGYCSSNSFMSASISGLPAIEFGSRGSGTAVASAISFTVPDGATYVVNKTGTVTLQSWQELV